MLTELEILGVLIKRVQHGHHRALDAGLARLGVSLVQWNALRAIEGHPTCSQHGLAEQTFNSDQAFGTLVTRLEARALVERRAGEGRAKHLALTPKGKALLRDGRQVMLDVLTASFAPLSKRERSTLMKLLHRVLESGASLSPAA
jgi:DNA-binding MarR family transcriptional regulator